MPPWAKRYWAAACLGSRRCPRRGAGDPSGPRRPRSLRKCRGRLHQAPRLQPRFSYHALRPCWLTLWLGPAVNYGRSWAFCTLALITHPLLDASPFMARNGFGRAPGARILSSIFIVDPAYTLPTPRHWRNALAAAPGRFPDGLAQRPGPGPYHPLPGGIARRQSSRRGSGR